MPRGRSNHDASDWLPKPGSSSVSYFLDGLRDGLWELGYIDGQNIRIETWWANGRFEKLPQLAIELVHLNVEVLVASLTQASLEAKKVTATIPIVMAGVGDPAAVGLIVSLSHPGGNVTGTSSRRMPAFGGKADMACALRNVSFMAQSGLRRTGQLLEKRVVQIRSGAISPG